MSSNQLGLRPHRRYRVSAGPSRHNTQALKNLAVAAARTGRRTELSSVLLARSVTHGCEAVVGARLRAKLFHTVGACTMRRRRHGLET